MNIFVTSHCPIACAEALDDKRLVKMVLDVILMREKDGMTIFPASAFNGRNNHGPL